MPQFITHENPNNILIVPAEDVSLENQHFNSGNLNVIHNNVTNLSEFVSEQIDVNYVLPEPYAGVLNEEGNVSAIYPVSYYMNEQCLIEMAMQQDDSTKYTGHRTLVNLTELSNTKVNNVPHSSSTSTTNTDKETLKEKKVIKNKEQLQKINKDHKINKTRDKSNIEDEKTPVKRRKLDTTTISQQSDQHERKKSNHEVLKPDKLGEIKSNKNSILRRYLDYQRFMHNYHKYQTKNSDDRKCEKRILHSTHKEKDIKVTQGKIKDVLHEKQIERKKERKNKMASLENNKTKKESTKSLSKYIELKDSEASSNKNSHTEIIKKQEKASVNTTKYLKKKEKLKEKEAEHAASTSKTVSAKKLEKYANKVMHEKLDEKDIKKKKFIAIRKKKEKESSNVDRKKKDKSDGKLDKLLKHKENKIKMYEKIKSYKKRERNKEIAKVPESSGEKIKQSKFKRIKNFEQAESEEETIDDKRSSFVPMVTKQDTVRTVDRSKTSSILLGKSLDKIDLRTVLTRKRINSPYHGESERNKRGKSHRENLLITVKQDVSAEPEQEAKIMKTKNKPKVIKAKNKSKVRKSAKIELVINIVCPKSADSVDTNVYKHSSPSVDVSPTQDLSFLDDFDVDDIVNSLNARTPNQEINSSPKKDLEENIDSEKELSVVREEKLVNVIGNSEIDMGTLRLKKELAEGLNADDSYTDESSKYVLNEEKTQLGKITNPCMVHEEKIDDDVYEVIDITKDADHIILLEDDTTDLESNTEHNDEQNNKRLNSSVNLTSNAEPEHKGEVIILDDDSKDKMNESNMLCAKISNEMKNTNEEPNPKCEKKETNGNNIDDNTFMQIETMLSKITHSNNEDIESNDLNKTGNTVDTKIINEEARVVATDTVIEDKQSNKINTKTQDKAEDIKLPNISDLKPDVDSSKLPIVNSNCTVSEAEIKNEIKDSAGITKLLHNTENKSKCKDEITASKTTSANVATDKVVENVVKQNNITKTESNYLKEEKRQEVANIVPALGKIPKVTGKQDENNTKLKSNQETTNNQGTKIEKEPTKPVPVQNVSCKKAVSNVAPNKEINATKMEVTSKFTNVTPTTEIEIDPKFETIMRSIEHRMILCLNKNITIKALLHKGYHSIIYKCQDLTGPLYALKILRSKVFNVGMYKDNLLRELQETTPKQRNFLLGIIDSFTSSGRCCYLTPYYPKTLAQALSTEKCFDIDLVRNLSRQLVAAVSILTNNNIIHTDVSPSHILLNHTNDRLKLCGFDRANFDYKMRITPSSGTVNYRAPEVILGFIADFRIDVWATALVMYEMTTSYQLFPGVYNNQILFQQLCAIGPLQEDMLQQCRLRHVHYLGGSFKRYTSKQQWILKDIYPGNNKISRKLMSSYHKHWGVGRPKRQVAEDLGKMEILNSLLEKMLIMDPRYRMPISFVENHDFFTMNWE